MDFRTRYEHPEYGEATITWEWEPTAVKGVYRMKAVAVEFDLFCPAAEQDELIDALKVLTEPWSDREMHGID